MDKPNYKLALDTWEDFGRREFLNKTITVQELFAFMRKHGEAVSISLMEKIRSDK